VDKTLAGYIRDETEHSNVNLVGLLDLHSYSQQILYPDSYTCDDSPPNLENLQEVVDDLSKVMFRLGRRYYQSAPPCKGNIELAATGDDSYPQ
jgi:extracellular matrix protein 14